MNVPELRFPEFEGEWKAAKAGDGFSNSRAKGEANLPIYSVTMDRGLVRRDSLDRHMHGDAADETNLRAQAGDIVYNMMRMWQGAAGIAEQECMVSPAYVVLSPKAQTSSEFFNYRIENARMLYLLWAYSHGLTSDRLRLYFNDFARIPIRQPSLPEQKKIAAFLGVVDAKIAALRARRDGLERYKRGLMQALFSQTLRFTKPDGTAFPDWEEKRLGEVFERVTRKNVEDNQNVLTISAQQGLVNQRDYFNKSVSAQDVSGYFLLHQGDFAYNKSYSKGYPMGAIKRLNLYDKGVVSTLYICFRAKTEKTARYYEQFFEFGGLNREIHKIAQEGARNHGLLNMSVVEFFKDMIVPYPHPDEQQKIADALSAMDAKIAAVKGQVAQMEAFKKGLLQQMFV